MIISINGVQYDKNELDLYDIPYRYVDGKLSVKNGKRYWNISSPQARRVINDLTMGNPEFLVYAPQPKETVVRFEAALGAKFNVSNVRAADLHAMLKPLFGGQSIKVLVSNGDTFESIRRAQTIFTKDSPISDYKELISLLNRFLYQRYEYAKEAPIYLKLVQLPNENAPMKAFKDGKYNCACAPVLDHLRSLKKNDYNDYTIKRVEKLNDLYLKDGIDDEGLQLLARTSKVELICLDATTNVWREFKSKMNAPKIILYAHNNHLTRVSASDVGSINIIRVADQEVIWVPPNFNWIELNKENTTGNMMMGKNDQIALITEETIWKSTFEGYEDYPKAFSSGGVGKAKFIEMCPQFKYGTPSDDPFYNLSFDSILSSIYIQNEQSARDNNKYDHNKSFLSAKSSPAWNGFPILEAVFKIDKQYSSLDISKSTGYIYGLLYVSVPTIASPPGNQKIYYECSGWYPVEIVKYYYDKYNIDPLILSYAYASTTFDFDFSKMTKAEYTGFFGTCQMKDSVNSWRTNDEFECLRGLYQLKDTLIGTNCIELDDGRKNYELIYRSEKKPWAMPIISSIVQHHQQLIVKERYNELVDIGIVPVAVRVDSIEIKKEDHIKYNKRINEIFDIGHMPGQWMPESIKVSEFEIIFAPRKPKEYDHAINPEFDPILLLPKLCHFSGSGGNGKTELLLKLKRAYPRACVMAPTHEACDVIQKRAIALGLNFKVHTYHSIFGIGCRVNIPNNCDHFIFDEGSMISSSHFRDMHKALQKHFGNNKPFGGATITIFGDFWQLPPISPMISLYNNWTGVKDPLYAQFTEIELTKNWRQQHDPEFYDDCQALRNTLTKEQAMLLIAKWNTRVVSSYSPSDSGYQNKTNQNQTCENQTQLPSYNTLDDMYIAGTNEQIDAVNSKCDKKNLTGVKVITIKAVMINKKTLSKGQILLVTKHDITGLYATQNGVEYFFKEYDDNVLKIAMALTVHKSQGKTLKGNVIIDPSRLFERNQLYVAITRATKFDNIYLTCPITFAQFCKTVRVV
jgi:hypothetical protein